MQYRAITINNNTYAIQARLHCYMGDDGYNYQDRVLKILIELILLLNPVAFSSPPLRV